VTKQPAAGRALTLGTAGHIDHGKTTLVKALTGRDTDRLREEKERGISIELGFAELPLPSGRRLSVVDVPGHERFVKTMVAGATGIDLFLLVVAADDGVMPQTREHLRIIELLGVPAGVVALTKIDMVDADLAELVASDVEDFLSSTRYSDAPIIPVSATTGVGLADLVAGLDAVAARVPARRAYPATRLPVDRVFSLKGVGTVVTGTLWSGALAPEDVVAILPLRGGRVAHDVRIRSVQVHDAEVAAAVAGQRVALNLTGVERASVARGQWIVKDPQIEPTYLVDARIALLPGAAHALERASRLRVDHGTLEVVAKMVLADRDTLEPGDSCYAQLRFDELVLVYPADPFVLRSLTPVSTVGGGRVIDSAPRKHGTAERWRERLMILEQGSVEQIVLLLLQESFPFGLTRRRLETSPYLWRFETPGIRDATSALLADGRAAAGPGPADNPVLFHGPCLAALAGSAAALLRKQAHDDALDPFLTVGQLRRELTSAKAAPALDAALDSLRAAGDVVHTDHGWRWAGRETASAGGATSARSAEIEAVLAAFSAQVGPERVGGAPAEEPVAETPSVAQVAEATRMAPAQVRKIVEALAREAQLVKVGEDLYYSAPRLQALITRLAAVMQERGLLTLAEARDLLGTSRKYAQALLEHMDSEGLTLRVGEARRLRRRKSG
jgi:selenocysteine-specific elongation factor